MIEAVLFDLDGTLITYRHSYADFMRRIAQSWNIDDENDPFFAAYYEAILADGSVTFTSAITTSLASTGRTVPQRAEETCRQAVADYAGGMELLPWASELLERYSPLPKAIVSNGPFDMQVAALQKFGLDKLVDHVVVSGAPDVGIRKPNPGIFRFACEKLVVEPAAALMIGDNESADIEGAKAAGLQAIHVTELVNAR